MALVYILKSKAENWYYVGSTNDIQTRLKQHNSKQVRSTKFRSPYELVYTEEYNSISDARKREKEIKSSRFIKEQIINKLALSSNG